MVEGRSRGERGPWPGGLLAKFERQIRAADPTLADAEVARRAESARQAHMARLALASSKARKARKAGGDRAAS